MINGTSEIENYKSSIKTVIDYARGQSKNKMTIGELQEELSELYGGDRLDAVSARSGFDNVADFLKFCGFKTSGTFVLTKYGGALDSGAAEHVISLMQRTVPKSKNSRQNLPNSCRQRPLSESDRLSLYVQEGYQNPPPRPTPVNGKNISKHFPPATAKFLRPPSCFSGVFSEENFPCPSSCFANSNISVNNDHSMSTKASPKTKADPFLRPSSRFATSVPIKPVPPVSNGVPPPQISRPRRFTNPPEDPLSSASTAHVSHRDKTAQLSFFSRSTGMTFASPMRLKDPLKDESNQLTQELKMAAFEAFEQLESLESDTESL